MSTKIFIQIASYRDDDLINTVDNLLFQAKRPENLTFGICWQHDADKDTSLYKYHTNKQIKIIDIDYKYSKGACWARSLTQKLYNNEDWTLQIDSHMRFEKHWDQILLDTYNDINDDSAILSSYPASFRPDQTYDQYDKRIHVCSVYGFKNGLLKTKPGPLRDKAKCKKARHLSAALIFGQYNILSVKYDPEFYFSGEEMGMMVRYWTSGFNIYHPNKLLCYHHYTRHDHFKHWTDHEGSVNLTIKCHDKLRSLLRKNNKYALGEFDLGTKRSMEEWKLYSGIDYQNELLNTHTIEDYEPPSLSNEWVKKEIS